MYIYIPPEAEDSCKPRSLVITLIMKEGSERGKEGIKEARESRVDREKLHHNIVPLWP